MAGMTKLDAVNACLAAINEYRVSALETGTTSIAAEAERYVDASTRYFCTMGWPCNTRRSVAFTPALASGEYQINLASTTVVKIKPAGPHANRNLVIRGSKVYDADKGSFNFLSTNTVFLDVAELLAFEELDPMLCEQVSQHACQQFARRQNGNQLADQYLSQELAMTDQVQERQSTFPTAPMIAQAQQQQRGG